MPSPCPVEPAAPGTRILLLAALAGIAGCGADGDHAAEPSRPGATVAPAVPPPVLEVGPDVPLDVRLVPLFPDRYQDQEILCDLEYLGQITSLAPHEASRFPFPAGQRAMARCAAPTGVGWAELVFSPGAERLAPYIGPGKRIRVVVRGLGTGVEAHPVLEFVAVVGEAPSYPPRDRGFAPVAAGFDFGRLPDEPSRIGARATCAILHVGPTLPIDPALAARYPTGATHHAVLGCRSARDLAWVDMALTAETLLGALRLERGVLLPVRIEARRGGYADLPVVSYVLR